MDKEDIKGLADKFSNKSAHEILRYFFLIYSAEGLPDTSVRKKDRIALASSLGAEDQVLTNMILTIHPNHGCSSSIQAGFIQRPMKSWIKP